MVNLPARKRDWLPRPPKRLSDLVGRKILDGLTRLEEAEPENIYDYPQEVPVVDEKSLEMFHYHSKWPSWEFLLILVVYLVESYFGGANLQIYGLLFDVLGASFLALGIVRGRAGLLRDIREKFGRLGDGSVNIHETSLKANAADTIDGIFGALFLLLGFAVQTLALAHFMI